MSYEIKKCPRCLKPFNCKPANMVHCSCSEIDVPKSLSEKINDDFSDCICQECLQSMVDDYLRNSKN